MDIKKEYERWLANATADADVVTELKTLDDAKIEDAFYRDLSSFYNNYLKATNYRENCYHRCLFCVSQWCSNE